MSNNVLIVTTFLAFSLIHGLFVGRGVKTFKHFAVGNKNFKTATLVATLVSTSFGGRFLINILSLIYVNGLEWVITILLIPITDLIVGQLMAIRMQEFLHHLSIAESMGALLGNTVRMITAVVGILFSAGVIGAQLLAIATVVHSLLDIDSFLPLCIALCIVLVYSMRGGIRAVTFTDIVQFITFTSLILTLIFLVSRNMHFFDSIQYLFTQNDNFILHKVIRWSPQFKIMLGWILLFIVPTINPANMHRFYMASSVWQAKHSFTYTALISFIICSVVTILAILLKASNDQLNPTKLLKYILSLYPADWFNGFMCIGVLALAMSTADSHMNSAAVLFANDIMPCLQPAINDKNKLLLAKLFTLIIGIVAFVLVFYKKNMWNLMLLFSSSIYISIVTAPFMMAVFGFRPRTLSVLLGMGAGGITTISFHCFALGTYLNITDIYQILTSLLMNLLFLIGSHYLLPKVPNRGWVGIKEKEPLLLVQQARRRMVRNWIHAAQHNLFWSTPSIYRGFGLYIMVSHIISSFFVQHLPYGILSLMAILWSGVFIQYAFSSSCASNQDEHALLIALWNLGLCLFLFIIPLIHFITNGYQLVHGIMLLINLLVANLLWPLSFVSLLSLFSMIFAYLFCNLYDTNLSLWTISSINHPNLIPWCSSITIILLLFIQYKKVKQHHKLIKKHLSELDNKQK